MIIEVNNTKTLEVQVQASVGLFQDTSNTIEDIKDIGVIREVEVTTQGNI